MRSFRAWFVLISWLVALPSFACSRAPGSVPPTEQELFTQAKAVFIAHVFRTEEKFIALDGAEKPVAVVEAEFRIVEVLKGEPPPDGKLKSLTMSPGNCAVLLLAGLDYIVFTPPTSELVWGPDGSRAVFNLDAVEIKKYLARLRRMARNE